jgi:two-component system cell cycle sensor histidine kinase/response regulator CckA
MLLFSGAGAPEQELVHLGMVVDEISVLLDTVVSPRARLVFQLEPDLPPVLGNPAAVRQIVMNLITNASEALEGRPGEIRIRTSSVSLEAEELAAVTLGWERTAGRYCVLEVSDDGCGMSAADKERIFDPFFSSKSFGRGLGLAAVLGAVRTMGGSVEVRSAPGEGSVFRILLPCAEGLAEEPEEGDNDADATLRGRVLVVDDELMVRETTSEFLELLGLEAVTVSSGEEGLRVLSEGGASIDAALLDMTMPGINGIETLRRMRGLGWTGPVVLCSGYVLGDTDVEPRPDAFLRKPYSIRKLQRTLEKLLLRT